MEKLVKYLTFKTFLEYKENFRPNSVIGKVLAINPELKKDIKQIIALVNAFANELKEKSEEEVKEFVEKNKEIEELMKKNIQNEKKNQKKEEKELPDLNLSNLKYFGKFRTRFEPSPSGPLHIGHSIGVIINYLYSKKYNGEFQLRIADTNPKNILVEAYDYIVEDVEYLTGKRFKPVIQSKRIKIYYEKVEELLKRGLAYVVLADKKEKEYVQIEKAKIDKTIVEQRNKSIEENLELWEKMLNNEFKEGEVIVRIKTTINQNPNEDLKDIVSYYKNSSLIDYPLFRIVEEEHPLVENVIVWPLMNFSVPIDDMLFKLSHIIRGKDHEMNGEKQKLIFKYFNQPLPEFIYFGRINFTDLKVSTTQTKKAILEGKFEDWSDLRLPFLKALKRRGIQRMALQRYAKEFGTSKADKKTTIEEFFKALYKYNREILDSKTNRYFLVENPLLIEIKGLKKEIELKLRPNSNEKRLIKVDEFVFVDENEIKKLLEKGVNKVRLMHLATIEIKEENGEIKANYIGEEMVKNKIHWVSKLNFEEMNLVKANNLSLTKKKVVVEKEALLNDIFQAERVGFIKNEKEKEQLIFMHR
jgi:glutamyl-tRNA synthetase